MDIYHYLMRDHKKVSALFASILSSANNVVRKRLQDKVLEELLIHAASEEHTFYKKLLKYDISKEEAEHGEDEHADIKNAIKKLIKQTIGTVKWRECLIDLKNTVQHHVKDEEGKMFRQARKVLTRQEELALVLQMERLKKQLKRKLEKIDEEQQRDLKKFVAQKTRRRVPSRISGIKTIRTTKTSARRKTAAKRKAS